MNYYRHLHGVVMRDDKTLYYIMFPAIIHFNDFKIISTAVRECTTIQYNLKDCKYVYKIEPNEETISKEDFKKVENYLDNKCMQLIANHMDQIKELNGKIILYTINEGRNETDDGVEYNNYKITLVYNEKKKNVKLVVWYQYDKWTEFGDDYTFSKNKDDKITAYITDDGYVNFMLRDGEINGKKFIYKKKLFDPSGILPYKLVVTYDSYLIVYDGNHKVLGFIGNEAVFKEVDFIWPSNKYFFDKAGKYSFGFSNRDFIFWENLYSLKKYSKVPFANTIGYKIGPYKRARPFGYLIVDKNGVLKYVIYESSYLTKDENGDVKTVSAGENKIFDQWETNTKAKGDGPYSLDFFNFNLVLLNGKGEVYWSSNDADVDKVNEEYQSYLKNLNN